MFHSNPPLLAIPPKPTPGFPKISEEGVGDDWLAAALKQARLLRSQGQIIEASDRLSEVYFGYRMTPGQRRTLAAELEPLSREVLGSHRIFQNGQLYEVQPGDTLAKLAKPFHITPEFVARLNGLSNPRSIQTRYVLKFVEGPFYALADTTEFELVVLLQGKFIRRFDIGIGKDDFPTPMGEFQVNDKLVNPTKWPDPVDRRKIAGGQPDNPLGSRWIGIGLGYGIHGTIEPETIGQKASRGCIRMRNEDVEELYDMLVEGSRVLIR